MDVADLRSPKMKNALIKSICGLLATLIIAGCASSSSTPEARRGKVPEFAFSPVLVASNAYHPPDAKWSSDVQSTITKYTGGGLIPALVGAAVDKHILSEQQEKFDKGQAPLLATINERASIPPSEVVEKAVMNAMMSNGFLATKVREKAKDVLEIKIVRFGLAKRNNEEESDPMMAAQILVDLTIRTGAASLLHIGGYSGSSADSIPISALAKDPEVIIKLYGEAADSLRDVLTSFLKRKYDE